MAIPVPEKRVAEFEKLGFGMIIHWGLYGQAGYGERFSEFSNYPRSEYEKLTKTFTASRFDAKKIVGIAKAAGMKYITLTARHIDGFSLYDTKGLTDFDAPHSACGRDLIREFVDACHEGGVKPMLYHATMDKHNPDFDGNFKEYLKYLRESIEILVSEYQGLGGIWLDGYWSKPAGTDWEEDRLYAIMRKYQPEMIILNNTGMGHEGEVGHPELDCVTYEQKRPFPLCREGAPKYLGQEMWNTMTNDEVWGVGRADFGYHSLPWLIESLCACRRYGANYLLNVGPDAEGDITPLEEAMLRIIGDWVRITGDAFYTTKPTAITCVESPKNFALRGENGKYYFYIHDLYGRFGDDCGPLPGGGRGEKTFTGIPGKIRSIRWTDAGDKWFPGGAELSFRQEGDRAVINCTGYPYGKNLVVRVAEAEME